MKQQDRTKATKEKLLNAAHQLFLTQGYEKTTLTMMLETAAVSKGGMYHHFSSKEDVFIHLLEKLAEEVVTQAVQAGLAKVDPSTSHMDRLYIASIEWMDRVTAPEYAKIILQLSPQVLGWQRAREIDGKYCLGLIETELNAAMQKGDMPKQPAADLAKAFDAFVNEIAKLEARDNSKKPELRQTMRAFLDGLQR